MKRGRGRPKGRTRARLFPSVSKKTKAEFYELVPFKKRSAYIEKLLNESFKVKKKLIKSEL